MTDTPIAKHGQASATRLSVMFLGIALLMAGCGTPREASTMNRDQLAAEIRRYSQASGEWYWSYHGTCDGYHYFSRSQPTELSLSKTQLYRLPADQMPIDSRAIVRLPRAPESVPPLSGRPCFEERRLVNDRLVVDYDLRHGVWGG